MIPAWPILCELCKHRTHGGYCKAFPLGSRGIPQSILDGRVAHLDKAPGDHGIQYERNPDVAKEFGYQPDEVTDIESFWTNRESNRG